MTESNLSKKPERHGSLAGVFNTMGPHETQAETRRPPDRLGLAARRNPKEAEASSRGASSAGRRG